LYSLEKESLARHFYLIIRVKIEEKNGKINKNQKYQVTLFEIKVNLVF